MFKIDEHRSEIISGAFKVNLDSRLIRQGEYFVAIKGDKFDGHEFINEVIEKGAAGVIEQDDLYAIARLKINTIEPKIIAITGSSGKSSVTSLITQLLESKFEVCKGSLNTKLGLSVDVVNNMLPNCEMFVAEMGMNGLGQIKTMTEMFKPDIAVITTINQTHTEKLGSISNITKAKSEILENMRNGIAVLNGDNIHIRKIGKRFSGRIIWFGENKKTNINFDSYGIENSVLLGHHNRLNLMAAIIVAKEVGMSDVEVKNIIPKLQPPKGRLNVIKGMNGSTLIDDTYNSSPVSAEFAIDVLASYKAKRKIAIVGDMLELGRFQKYYHKKLGEYVVKNNIDLLITVGNLSKETHRSGIIGNIKSIHIDRSSDFEEEVMPTLNIGKGDVVLIKGSQGVRMEKITEVLMENKGDAINKLVRQDIRWKK